MALTFTAGLAPPVDHPVFSYDSATRLNAGAGFFACVEMSSGSRDAGLHWRHYEDGVLGGEIDGMGFQPIALTSIPLAFELLSENRVFYAGQREDGSVVYEVWQIERPRFKPVPTGEFDDFVYSKVVNRMVLSGLPENKLGTPCWCTDNRALSNGVLIGFAGTSSIYGLTWSQSGSAEFTELASRKKCPLLGAEYVRAYSGKHKRIGFIYTLISPFWSLKPGPKTLLLIDSNCDGTIDSISKPDTALLRSQGFDDESLWLERAGLSTRSGPP